MPHLLDNLRFVLARADEVTGDRARSAKQSGVPPERLAALEQQGDLAGWTTSMAESLARVARVDPASIWSDAPLSEALRLHFLRDSGWPDFHAGDLDVFVEVLEQASALRALREVLGDGETKRARFATKTVAHPPHEQGYELARAVRKEIGLGADPVLNLQRLVADHLDILVVRRELGTARLEAAAIVRTGAEAVVLNEAVERRPLFQRRAIAHELCHVLFDRRTRGVLAVLDGEEDETPHEQRARAFAAEFLVPEDGLVNLIGVPEKTRDLDEAASMVGRAAKHFRAPTELVSNHLVNRGFVRDSLREALIRATARLRPPCTDVAVDVLAERVRRAVDEYRITEARAAELLAEAAAANLQIVRGGQ